MAIKKKNLLESDLSFGKITLLQKSIFIRNLSIMLKSGLDIVEALGIARDQTAGRFKNVIADIAQSVQSGNSLSSAFRKYSKIFPPLVISTTLAGESSGTLAENLENVADHLKKNYQLVSKVKGAMIYPVILIIGALVLGLVLSFAVLPKIIPLFENLKVDLPITTRLLIIFTHFIQAYRIEMLVGVVAGVIFLQWFIKRSFAKPVTHWLLIKIPIIKDIVINSNLANFCNTLGMLLKSGLIIDEALSISKEVASNYYYKKALIDVYNRTIQGNELSDNLQRHSKLFPKMVISLIKVGEKSGNLEGSLFHLSTYYEDEVDSATKSLSVAIEPVLLILIGAVVGLLAVSIITPIYKLTGSAYK